MNLTCLSVCLSEKWDLIRRQSPAGDVSFFVLHSKIRYQIFVLCSTPVSNDTPTAAPAKPKNLFWQRRRRRRRQEEEEKKKKERKHWLLMIYILRCLRRSSVVFGSITLTWLSVCCCLSHNLVPRITVAKVMMLFKANKWPVSFQKLRLKAGREFCENNLFDGSVFNETTNKNDTS